ncbi:MAG TPA: hypothetical protein ENF93_00360, partial [Ignisphaera sp.]|nr:hypothetical protein [Ignisphaera sp.]
ENRIKEIIDQNITKIALLKYIIDNESTRLNILRLAVTTQYVFVVEGWIPNSNYDQFVNYVNTKLKYAIIESVDIVEEPPVELRNPKPLKSFEIITKLYGYPSPHEWDPTPILAYSFAAFYGIMLGDAGYGIGQIIATRYLLPKFVENPESEDFKHLQRVLYATGIVSIILGFLMGSFFGPRPLPTSVFPTNLVETMKLLMAISLLIGFIHVIIAHLIAAAKNLKLNNKWVALNEIAIIMAMVFGGPYTLYMIKQIELPEPLAVYVLQPLTFISLALIVLSKIKSLGAIGIMLWLFDLTGALGDVLSYLRLAGLAIATIILAKVFNEIGIGIMASMSAIAGPFVGIVLSAIVGIVFFFIAHLFNLAISILGAFVHSLRLCMLEFSSKFFEGTGKPFRPVRMVLTRYIALRK